MLLGVVYIRFSIKQKSENSIFTSKSIQKQYNRSFFTIVDDDESAKSEFYVIHYLLY